MMKNFLAGGLTAFVLLTFCIGESRALAVPNECASPKSSSQRRFYVDPLNGSMSNDGSIAKPWRSLAEVLDNKRRLVATSSAIIKPGDVIYLNSGDHGNVQIVGAANSEFITIQAAPDQTPILRSLRINGSSKWIFLNLKVQGAGDGSDGSAPGSALIELGRNPSFGPTSNIIFSGNSVSTTDDSKSWTESDWTKKPFLFGLFSSATCVSVTSNHFFNLRNAIYLESDYHLIAENKIDNFGADAIDIAASNVTVRGNSITGGRNTKTETIHSDAIQGWTRSGATNTNVMIDGNIIIKTGDQSSYLQGICIFDGKWDGLTISNNVVLTNHWHGITVFGAKNAKIINNTLVSYEPAKRPTWITVQNAKDGRPSERVIVRNNLTTQLVHHGDGVIVDHNIVSRMIVTSTLGKPIYILKPGAYGNHNTIDPNIYDSLLRVDHSKESYDFRLKSDSPAIGAGSPELAPKTDILGKRRVPPIDIGAYAKSR